MKEILIYEFLVLKKKYIRIIVVVIMTVIFSLIFISSKARHMGYVLNFKDLFFYYYRGIEILEDKKLHIPINYMIRIITIFLITGNVFSKNHLKENYNEILFGNSRTKWVFSKYSVCLVHILLAEMMIIFLLFLFSKLYIVINKNVIDLNKTKFIMEYYEIKISYEDVKIIKYLTSIISLDIMLSFLQALIMDFNMLMSMAFIMAAHKKNII